MTNSYTKEVDKKIINLVEEIKYDKGRCLDNFREIYDLWGDSSFDNQELYNAVILFQCDLDFIPRGEARKKSSKKWLEYCDKEEKDFYQFYDKNIINFIDDFFKYIQEKST